MKIHGVCCSRSRVRSLKKEVKNTTSEEHTIVHSAVIVDDFKGNKKILFILTMYQDKDSRIEVVANSFGKFQRDISTAEARIMQLKVSLKHKSNLPNHTLSCLHVLKHFLLS
jgi:hypothetical protein